MSCVPGDTDNPAEVIGFYTSPKASYVAVFGVPATVGSSTTHGTDSALIEIYQSSSTGPDLTAALSAMGALYAPSAGSDATGDSSGQLPAGWKAARVFAATAATKESATTTSTEPLTGRVSFTGVANPTKASSAITVAASFACSS
jgi:hypothetical protein